LLSSICVGVAAQTPAPAAAAAPAVAAQAQGGAAGKWKELDDKQATRMRGVKRGDTAARDAALKERAADLEAFAMLPYWEIAWRVVRPFVRGRVPDDDFGALCRDAYDFEVPIERYAPDRYLVRLDRGPTASFKDFAARLIEVQGGEALARIPADEDGAYQFALLAEELVLENIAEHCESLGIRFDVWFSERSLFGEGAVERKLAELRERGVLYEKEGATWLRTSDFGDEEDRVLVRSTGATTYLMTDLAYAENRFARGFDRVIYVWGPDHAAQVPSLQAGLAAMGADPERTEFIVHQIVRLIEGGEPLRMSKRRGNIVTLQDLLEEVGKDVARSFLLSRSIDSHLDFDLDLARKQSDENPVYYVQYAHARICSIQREARARGFDTDHLADADLTLLEHPDEARLLRYLADYPAEVSQAAPDRAPHSLTHLARELAATFHQLYGTCRVLEEAQPELSQARLALVRGTQIVLRNLLGILGVTAPEKM